MKYEFKWWEVVLLSLMKMRYSFDLEGNVLTTVSYKVLFGERYVLESSTEILKDVK